MALFLVTFALTGVVILITKADYHIKAKGVTEKIVSKIQKYESEFYILFAFLILYVVINIVICTAFGAMGASKVNGQYVIASHGTVIRMITKSEFIHAPYYLLRLYTGFLMLCCYWAMVEIMNIFKRKRKATDKK